MKFTKQKSSDKMWVDEAGNTIPYDRITKYERTAEIAVHKMAAEATRINQILQQYKESVFKEAERLYELFTAEKGVIGKGKGGASFYNFDRSIKVIVNVHEAITFDENTIELAKQALDELLNDGLIGAKEFVKPLVMDAFKTSNGRLDTKQVLGLKKHKSRIHDERFSKACDLIDQAIRRPSSKEYYQVWIRNEQGEYENVQLNFASV